MSFRGLDFSPQQLVGLLVVAGETMGAIICCKCLGGVDRERD